MSYEIRYWNTNFFFISQISFCQAYTGMSSEAYNTVHLYTKKTLLEFNPEISTMTVQNT